MLVPRGDQLDGLGKNQSAVSHLIVLHDSCAYLRVRMLDEPHRHTLHRFHPFVAPVPLSLSVQAPVPGNSAPVDASHNEADVQPIPPTARVRECLQQPFVCAEAENVELGEFRFSPLGIGRSPTLTLCLSDNPLFKSLKVRLNRLQAPFLIELDSVSFCGRMTSSGSLISAFTNVDPPFVSSISSVWKSVRTLWKWPCVTNWTW